MQKNKTVFCLHALSTLLVLGFFSAGAASAPPALSLPTGGQIVAGQATIVQSGARMDIHQASDRAILNWSTFNIGASSAVHFSQPSANAIALNRVISSDPSQIFGTLSSNGQVFLVNPNGVLFGQGASANVGGMVASTLSLADDSFLSGAYRFTRAGSVATVVNEGALASTAGGYIALLAPEVRNQGVLSAPLGTVALGAGEAITLGLEGHRLLTMVVEPGELASLVENKQLIRAPGGTVLLSAQAADQLLGSTINAGGIIEAQGFSNQNGKIVLDGGPTGLVSVTGTLDASGKGEGQTGGTIAVMGDRVGLFGSARIDVSGDLGGGNAFIGGNFLGQGPERNASATFVSPLARIDANAITLGNGGNVAIWADGYTNFHGGIEAKGGAQGGDGGRVETSGKHILDVGAKAYVDASAPKGGAGTWLLDPWVELTITSADDQTRTWDFSGTNPIVFRPDYDRNTISAAALFNKLTAASVTITTSFMSKITLDSDLDYNGIGTGKTLTLIAKQIVLNGSVFDSNPASRDNLSLVLTADALNQVVLNHSTLDLRDGSFRTNASAPSGDTSISRVITATGGITFNADGTVGPQPRFVVFSNGAPAPYIPSHALPQTNDLLKSLAPGGPAKFETSKLKPDATEMRLQTLYIAYFGRAADPIGLSYWASQVAEAGSDTDSALNAVSKEFARAPEFASRYTGFSDTAVVNQLIKNLFGRDAAPSELLYWTEKLSSGKLDKSQIVQNIIDSAQGSDAQALENAANDAANSMEQQWADLAAMQSLKR